MSNPSARDRFLTLLRAALNDASLVKLTLGKSRSADATLQNLFVRPVTLKAGPHLSLLWRHATRDVTKNHPPTDALALLEPLIGNDFLDAHLFTPIQTAQFETRADGHARLSVKTAASAPAQLAQHPRCHQRLHGSSRSRHTVHWHNDGSIIDNVGTYIIIRRDNNIIIGTPNFYYGTHNFYYSTPNIFDVTDFFNL